MILYNIIRYNKIVYDTIRYDSIRYNALCSCWLSAEDGTIWAFAGPVLAVMLVRHLKTFVLKRCYRNCRLHLW